MKFRTFQPKRETRPAKFGRRLFVTLACAHIILAGWSLYRRIWQVLHLEVHSSAAVLVPGSTVSYNIITTGEVHNRILLELVQGSHSEILREERGRVSSISMYDPRVFRSAPTIRITDEQLAKFVPGRAVLRLTGFGGQKLLRTPPDRVRELVAELGPVGANGSPTDR